MCPIFITVGSCPGIATRLITVHGVNPWLDFYYIDCHMECISYCLYYKDTSASAHVPCCDIIYLLNSLPMNPLYYFQ